MFSALRLPRIEMAVTPDGDAHRVGSRCGLSVLKTLHLVADRNT
nr:hypothetical protein JVH1_8107 [Rhodococcus sp. JVH1]